MLMEFKYICGGMLYMHLYVPKQFFKCIGGIGYEQ